jgi:hypothetical protein
VNSLGYLVRVLTYSNLMLCIYTVPCGGEVKTEPLQHSNNRELYIYITSNLNIQVHV